MSLDVYLTTRPTGVFVRENWANRELTRAEVAAKFDGAEVPEGDERDVFSRNITHNLGRMAREAGIYQHCWRPEEIGITTAAQLVEPLKAGLDLLKSDPERFKAFNAMNGWGVYEHFVEFVEAYHAACVAFPSAKVSVSR